ncbi:MarR family winged helix-turn-helix transcriptional regulator [Arvimicrobium flavum]|uniref:MarR family winged helix-turn-helix transcriptional regulator n=1 Tax=Arvimicrobium flavum TaxID=3393320 RepID=UPI00237A5F8D|nr:MarR family transcriptional regulator [Mesorhizobium shangrilense]
MTHSVNPDGFGFLATDLARLVRADFDRAVAGSGIGVTAGEARTLSHAARAGLVRQNVLAERMGVEAMTVTGFLDRLEAKQLIRRVADPADRRAKLVQVTEAADEVLATIKQLGTTTRAKASAGMDARDWERFMSVLKAARDNLAGCRAAPTSQGPVA